jgi:virginiamycin B lyase
MFTEIQMRLLILLIIFALPLVIHESSSQILSPPTPVNTNQQLVTYQKQSNFIHEFSVPNLIEKGLKGIVTDFEGNAWFYHQTNKTSTIMKFNPENNTFNSYPIEGKTVTDNPVINLAGGQIIYDEKRNSIWFTDARINSIGRLDTNNGKIELTKIPTNNSGIMGIVLSPNGKEIWYTEIIGNKIGRFDIQSRTIDEYPTGDTTGPTLISFDNKGELWVTLSYAKSMLKVQPWLLIPENKLSGMFEIKLEEPDTFSPFGIAITSNGNKGTIYLSDHGSSRVIGSNLTSEFKEYVSYWTSPSQAYPATLPSQVVSDKFGNVYFPEHGGNRISKISPNGLLTEFDIPTGPLATAVYIASSADASKIWFTEWASNRIAYLDNSLVIPLELKPKNASRITLEINQTYPLDILVTKNNITGISPVSLDEIELSTTGMTDSGLQGLTYLAKPQRFNMTENLSINGTIDLTVDAKEAIAGKYTVMPRILTLEKDDLTVSLLYPQGVTLDVPVHQTQIQNLPSSVNNEEGSNSIFIFLRDLARYTAIGVTITLIGYLVYRKIARRRLIGNK